MAAHGHHVRPPERTHEVHPNLILAVLSLAGLAYAALSSAVIPALPEFRASLHTSETGVAWLLTAFLLSASVGTSILGRLGDIYGKERTLVATLLILAFGTLLGAVATSLPMLIVARVIQGAGGGIFPLGYAIVRDEFPPHRVAGSIGLMSSILGIGGGLGSVIGALVVQHLGLHWLFWIPLFVTLVAAAATWRYIPESAVRAPGRINYRAAGVMSLGLTLVLIGVTQTTSWGWGGTGTLALLAAGLLVCGIWVIVEVRSSVPLVDMGMMRLRGVWTTNLSAFLLGGGVYSSFLLVPEFMQLPKSTGFGFGASVFAASLYLLPAAVAMTIFGILAGPVAGRFGSKLALIAGSAAAAAAFAFLAVLHAHPYDILISMGLMGTGIGLSYSALGNLIVRAVPPHQTGVASGMNTVMRTLGGALGGQLAATFVAGHTAHGLPALTGFTASYWLGAGFLVVCLFSAMLVPTLGQGSAPVDQQLEPRGTAKGVAA